VRHDNAAVSIRKVMWQLRHPLSSPPWLTEDDEERTDRQWEDLGGRWEGVTGDALRGTVEDSAGPLDQPHDPAQ
jgi:hypothetical protein